METAGYIAAFFIGISLGLIGGGGSILTVPLLVYLYGLSPTIAVSYSLFIVGTTSLVGALNNLRQGWVDLKTVLLFGVSSVLTTVVIRKLVIPNIPSEINVAGWHTSFDFLTMVLFAVLMLFASVAMIKGRRELVGSTGQKNNIYKLFLYGLVIGSITGFLGAGGGFLLIPALVLLLKLPMKRAVGTSLLIIAINSLIGFAADMGQYETNWSFLSIISTIAIAGVMVGGLLSGKIEGNKLRKAFGWFVLLMGIFIIVRETLISAS